MDNRLEQSIPRVLINELTYPVERVQGLIQGLGPLQHFYF